MPDHPPGFPDHHIHRPGRTLSCLLTAVPLLFMVPACTPTTPSLMKPEVVRSSVSIHAPGEDVCIEWEEFIEAAITADIVVLGEMHDDHVGHLVQRAVVEDLVARSPNVVVAMEMLERDEQNLVDDYRDGLISAEVLTKRNGSSSWAGEGSWDNWYLPIIDAAHEGGARVVAHHRSPVSLSQPQRASAGF